MADKYCIASGSMTDPTLWSPSGVPTSGDDVIFDRDVTVDDWHCDNSVRNVSVVNGANVHLIGHSPGAYTDFTLKSNKTLSIDGHLEYTCTDATANIIRLEDGNLEVKGNSTLKINAGSPSLLGQVNIVSFTDNTEWGYVVNRGFVDAQITLVVLTNVNSRHVIGKAKVFQFRNQRQTQCCIEFAEKIDVENLFLYTLETAIGPLEIDFGVTEIRTKRLQILNSAPHLFTIRHNGLLDVSGNIETTQAGEILWTRGSSSRHVLSGTANQTISLPESFSGSRWIVDKPAGTLNLQSFNGSLLGRLQNLVVGDHCNVDLDGPAPYLPNSRNEYSYYNGLKADSVSERNLAAKRLESMTCCENRSLLAIPAGRQLWAKQFQNKAGAQVTGNGLLGIRYGGLENSGTIDRSIWQEVFDVPDLLPLATLRLKYGERPGRIDAEWTRAENAMAAVDWGDGTPPVECVEVAGVLSHAYSASGCYDIEINARSDTRKSRARVGMKVVRSGVPDET